MASSYSKLKGRIIEKYGSQAEFARILGTYDTVVSRKMQGNVGFTHDDIVKWCNLLDIKQEEIGGYFF